MKRWFWFEGRFGWPFITVLLFVTVSAVVFDFVHRVVVLPFTALAAYAIMGNLLAIALVIIAFVFARRRSSNRRHA